ncbi:substrate-binding domain-containing protein [Streptomyces sp. NPDC001604]|uniref:substrate-binding domain-containing protein n=1 Tax=Streptomyces sp. NPDC001604 TaxID=3364593 RepID=UPI00367B1C8A
MGPADHKSSPGHPGRPLDPRKNTVQAFAWALVRIRTHAHLTLDQLAEKAHFSKHTLSRVTNGETLPGPDRLEAYAAACKENVGQLHVGQWKELRDLAEQTVAQPGDKSVLGRFADALVSACEVLPDADRKQLGSAQELVSAWAPEDPPWWRRRPVLVAGGAVLTVTVVTGALLVAWEGPGNKGTAGAGLSSCAKPTQTLRIASSTDKSATLTDLAADYGPRLSHGQCVRVAVDSIDSGTAMRALADGWNTAADGPSPDVWSPASHVWLQIARHRAVKAQDRDRLPESADASIVTSPLTIAMPEPAAKKLGWPDKKISWQDLAGLANTPGFKLGKTNPETSTSGLNATFASFYAQTGTSSELTTQSLHDQATQEKVRAIEKSVLHYGDTTLTYLANLRRYDEAGQAAAYVSAVTVEENSVVAYNMGYPCGVQSREPGCGKTKKPPSTKLVAFHPTNADGVGTIYSDHPYITLGGLSAAKKDIAADFRHFLTTSQAAQDAFAAVGFRTPKGGLTARITPANGVLHERLPDALGEPSDEVLDQLLTVWRQLRKPANVLLLIDTSASMDRNAQGKERVPGEPSKLDLVKKAHGALLDGFTDTDKVGLWHFSDQHTTDDPIARMDSTGKDGTTQRQRLERDVDALKKDAGTALYATIDDAVKNLRDHYDTTAINAVVVLTDGCDQTAPGGPGLEEVTGNLGDPDERPVRVFTIAYGSDACRDKLQDIATASHARAYDAKDPNTIDNVLTNVISNF